VTGPRWIVPSPPGVGVPGGDRPRTDPEPRTNPESRISAETEQVPNMSRTGTEPMTVEELRRRRRTLGCTWSELARAMALIGVEVSPSTLRSYTDRVPDHVARALQRIEAMHRATGRIPGQAYPEPPPLPYDCRM